MKSAAVAPAAPVRINFARGVPAEAAFPRSEIELCVQALVRGDDPAAFQYGHAAGPLRLREWIARRYQIETSHVIVGNGSIGLFDLLCRVTLKPGQVVLVEAPCYDRVLQLLRYYGADVRAVRIAEDGPVIEDIERVLAAAKPSFLYMVPDFHNPSGATYSLQKRQAIVALARTHGFRLVEDSPYRLLRYRGQALPSFHELAADVTIQLGSFSKLLCPALRAAYLLADPATVAQITEMAENSYVTPGNFALSVAAEWLSRGLLEPQVERLKQLYAPRLAAMIAALEEYLPDDHFPRPEGGFFIGLTLPNGEHRMRIPKYASLPVGQLVRQSLSFAVVALTLLCCPCLAATQAAAKNEPVDKEFLAWALQNLHPIATVGPGARLSDLEPLRRMIGNASVVSLGEGLHGGAEPLEFRNLLFRFLVEKMGFTAIAIESGITEGYGVNEYVLGGPGDLKTVVARGFHPAFNKLPQSAALAQWMREYNADPKHSRKIEFYGFILPGSDGNSKMDLALEDALRYLDGVDAAAAITLRNRTKAILPMLVLDRLSAAPNRYPQLAQPLRDQMTAAIADMISLFKIRQAAYTAASSDRAYQLAYRSAVVAGQIDEYLRQVPLGWTPKAGPASLSGTVAVSDRAAADNFQWIKEQQGPDGKILVFAHRDHVATALVSIRLPSHKDPFLLPPMMGTYLQRRYGEHLITIGNLFAQDTSNCERKRLPAASGSLEALLSTLNTPLFLLDLRTAPRGVAAWLQQSHELYGLDFADSLKVGKAFDIVFFSGLVTPAAPCS